MLDEHLKELRRLYGKFREGTLTLEEALGGYVAFILFSLFWGIPCFAFWFIDFEGQMEEDQGVPWIIGCLFVLVFIMMLTLLSRSLPQKPSLFVRIGRLLGSVIIAAILASISGFGYFIFWNAVSGNEEKTLVSGPVVHMEIQRGTLYTGKPYYITLRYENRDVKLTISPEEYAQLNPGQTYYREMHLGGLGYYYNWGSKWWK